MATLARAVIAYIRALFLPRHKLALEAAALRQQLAVLKRKQPRPKLHRLDRLFWIALRHVWAGWVEALIIVKPETVVSWHRAGFRLFWRWRSSSRRPGRPKVSEEIRQLIDRVDAVDVNRTAESLSDVNTLRETNIKKVSAFHVLITLHGKKRKKAFFCRKR